MRLHHMPEYKPRVFYWGNPERAPCMREVCEF